MSELSLKDIVSVLRTYEAEFGFLDVFASDVTEIAQRRQVFANLGNDRFRTSIDGVDLELQVFKDKNVARFRLLDVSAAQLVGGAVAGATLGAMVGASMDSSSRTQAPTGLVFGLLLGGVIGAAAGHAVSTATSRPPRPVLTLRYDPALRQW